LMDVFMNGLLTDAGRKRYKKLMEQWKA
jgi:hypothetical protein